MVEQRVQSVARSGYVLLLALRRGFAPAAHESTKQLLELVRPDPRFRLTVRTRLAPKIGVLRASIRLIFYALALFIIALS